MSVSSTCFLFRAVALYALHGLYIYWANDCVYVCVCVWPHVAVCSLFIKCSYIPFITETTCDFFYYVPEASLELGKQRTLRKSSSIWLTLLPPIRAALRGGTRSLCRCVTVQMWEWTRRADGNKNEITLTGNIIKRRNWYRSVEMWSRLRMWR